jgi:hypothetical protein
VAFPYDLHRDDPLFSPPLRRDVRAMLSRERNPFFERAEAEYFLARRDGRVVGRVAAIHNRAHNEFHADRTGFSGFFECADDLDAARVLQPSLLRVPVVARAVGGSAVPLHVPEGLVGPLLALTGRAARLFGRVTVLSSEKAPELLAAAWTCASGALARDAGWQARIGLREGLEGTARWYAAEGWL